MEPSSDQIVYEHPLNERSRSLLRLEHLFRQTEFHLPQDNPWNSRAAVDGLLGMASIFARADLKADFIKELDRHQGNLKRIAQTPGVDPQRLGSILDELSGTINDLQRLEGQIGRHLRANELLKNVMQRNGIPGASCAFDLPAFHHWLQQPQEKRVADLTRWLEPLKPAQSAVTLLLALTRGSSSPEACQAPEGIYQRTLDPQLVVQMIRIALPGDTSLFPEISGGKHRFSIRFMESDSDGRPAQTKGEVSFEITLCTF